MRTVSEVKNILEQEIGRKEKLIASGHKLAAKFAEQNEKAYKMLNIVAKWCERRPSQFAYITPDEQKIISLYNIDLTI